MLRLQSMIIVISFFLGLIFLVGPRMMTAQTVQITYKKQIIPNMENIPQWFSGSSAAKREFMQGLEEKANNERDYFSLVTDGANALFTYDTTIVIKKQKGSRRWGRGRFNAENSYYWNTNLRTGSSVKRSDVLDESICTEMNNREEFQWKMGGGIRVFADVLCHKAYVLSEKGDSTIAWFARSIPISGGPQEYGGLPGMILAVETPFFLYIAEEIKRTDKTLEPISLDIDSCLPEKDFNDKAWRAYLDKMIRNER